MIFNGYDTELLFKDLRPQCVALVTGKKYIRNRNLLFQDYAAMLCLYSLRKYLRPIPWPEVSFYYWQLRIYILAWWSRSGSKLCLSDFMSLFNETAQLQQASFVTGKSASPKVISND